MGHSLGSDECNTLNKAFSGFGVDEASVISLLGKWHPEQRKSFRKSCPAIFKEDERFFERIDVVHVARLKTEFSRFKKAVVLWTMHPWERDARLANEVIHKGAQVGILIEVACTRSSEELLGARRAHHSIFHRSLEEDVAFHAHERSRKLLLALVSSYRYEGSLVNDEIAKSEAKILGRAIKEADVKKAINSEDVVRILSTRSKSQLKKTFTHYKEIFGNAIDQDLEADLILQATVRCLSSPATYFSKVLEKAFADGADETQKMALTRVVVTRADVDMQEIKEEYHKSYGVSLPHKIEKATSGNYKDFLLALVGREA